MKRLVFVVALLLVATGITMAQPDVRLPDAGLSVAARRSGMNTVLYIASGDWSPETLPTRAHAGNADLLGPFVLTMTLSPDERAVLLTSLERGPIAVGATGLGAFGGQRLVWWATYDERGRERHVAIFVGDGNPSPVMLHVLTESDRKTMADAIIAAR